MKRILWLLAALALATPANAADNYAATAGSGLTFGAKSVGGILFPQFIPFDNTGAACGVTGNPFYVGKGAALERALINFFLDQAAQRGYKEIMPPIVVNEESARGTGQIPDKEDLMYIVERDKLYMIPTAEVPVTNFHRDEQIAEQDLPIRYAGEREGMA